MNRAINVLKARIEKIEERMKETQKVVDEPEMMSDYEFAINDLGNYELEIIELQRAIQILIDNKGKFMLHRELKVDTKAPVHVREKFLNEIKEWDKKSFEEKYKGWK